ncbi:hypothetical protein B7494_g3422 [Chlorociboria aeruginascens]|nr:hypothetical protein B7494_g3422 [Chlorociboria aeruginascens]
MAHIYNSQLDAYSLYHKTHEEYSSTFSGPALPALGHALAGSTGTAISNLATYPLDLIITLLQVQRSLRSSSSPSPIQYSGVLDAFQQIYDQGGIAALYTGVLHDTGKSIADSFLFFLVYNGLRTNRLQKNGAKTTTLPVFEELAIGALAGACSKFCTTPLANIVTRKQTASMRSSSSSSAETKGEEPTVQQIAKEIREEKGIQGFWAGYSASLILTLNPSLTFFLYETFKRILMKREKRNDPGARMTFLMAAVSKAIASTITYPFSLAKTRAQSSSTSPLSPSPISFESKEEAARKVARNTIFSAIFKIYRDEGVGALYEGVWGEILKGFFSHGITMIVKEEIHRMIIRLYYAGLRMLNRFPSPLDVAAQAEERIKGGMEGVGEVGNNATQYVRSTEGGKVVGNVVAVVRERIGVIGNNATELMRSADGKEVLGNTSQAVGGKIEDLGKGIKSGGEEK